MCSQVRHKEEVEQIRSAGHSALAVIVEEHKVRIRTYRALVHDDPLPHGEFHGGDDPLPVDPRWMTIFYLF